MMMLQAAQTLQKAWRHHWRFARTGMIVNTLTQTLKLTGESVKAMTLTDSINLLKNKEVVDRMYIVMTRLLHYAMRRHGDMSFDKAINARVLLTAFMIVYKTEQTMDNVVLEKEANLYKAAVDMVGNFEKITSHYYVDRKKTVVWHDIPASDTANFLRSVSAFLEAFYIWKPYDEQRIVKERMKKTLVRLYQAKTVLRLTDPRMMELFDQKIAAIRQNLSTLCDAKEMEDLSEEKASSLGISQDKSMEEEFVDDMIAGILNKMTHATWTPEQLMHEIMLEGAAFSLWQDSSLLKNDAFWSGLVADLSQTVPNYDKVLNCLSEFRKGIISLAVVSCPCCMEKYQEIARIEKKIKDEKRLSDEDACTTLERMMGLLSIERATAGTELTDFVQQLRMCVEAMQEERMRKANTSVHNLMTEVAPVYGIVYERTKFEKTFAGKTSLDKTMGWLRSAMAPDTTKNTVLEVHTRGVVMLIQQDESDRIVPETWVLDTERLQKLHAEFKAIVQTNIGLLVAPTLLESMTAPTSEVFKRLAARFGQAIMQRVMSETDDRVVRIIPTPMPPALEEKVVLFTQAVRKMATLNRQVYSDYYDCLVTKLRSALPV